MRPPALGTPRLGGTAAAAAPAAPAWRICAGLLAAVAIAQLLLSTTQPGARALLPSLPLLPRVFGSGRSSRQAAVAAAGGAPDTDGASLEPSSTIINARLDTNDCGEPFSGDGVQQALRAAPRNVFFLRTTNESRLTPLEECAVRSAALRNPSWRVNVFSNSLRCSRLKGALANVHVVRYAVREVVAGHALLTKWHRSRVWDVPFRGAHLSDGMRLALLHAYGGVYLDTDVLSLRPLDGLRNAVGTEDEWMLNNAVLAFEPGHPFLRQAIRTFAATFDPWYWGWNGPRLVTRVWKAFVPPAGHAAEGGGGGSVMIVPRTEFYPLGWRQAELLVAPAAQHAPLVRRIFTDARVLHAWHHITSAYLERAGAAGHEGGGAGAASPMLIDVVMAAVCPVSETWDDREDAPEEERKREGGGRLAAAAAASTDVTLGGYVNVSRRNGVLVVAVGAIGEFELSLTAAGGAGAAMPPFTAHPCGGLGAVPPLHSGPGRPSDDVGGALLPPWLVQLKPVGLLGAATGAGATPGQCSPFGSDSASVVPAPFARVDDALMQQATGFSAAGGSAEPTHAALTLSFWLNTVADSMTLRPEAHALPPLDPKATPPRRSARSPPTPLSLDAVRALGVWPGGGASIDSLHEGVALFGNALVVAVEDGHVTAGGLDAELVRSEHPLNDGQWHHVALIISSSVTSLRGGYTSSAREHDGNNRSIGGAAAQPPARGRVVLQLNMTLYVDGLMHEHAATSTRARSGLSLALPPVSVGGEAAPGSSESRRLVMRSLLVGQPPARAAAAGVPLVHLDAVVAFPSLLSQTALLQLRNHQQLLASLQPPCLPYHQHRWADALAPSEPLGRPQEDATVQLTELGPQLFRVDGLGSLLAENEDDYERDEGAASVLPPRVLLMILSDGQPSSAAKRHACRSTWLQLPVAGANASARGSSPVLQRHVFIVPASHQPALESEAGLYGDLLFVHAPDEYSSVSRKVLLALAAVSRAASESPLLRFDVLLKTDHDVFVRLDAVHRELAGMHSSDRAPAGAAAQRPWDWLWWGFAYDAIPPIRDYADRNAELTLPLDAFPAYTAGVLYALGRRLVRAVLVLPRHQLSINEDQTLGLWIAAVNAAAQQAAGRRTAPVVAPRHDLRMQQWSVCVEDQLAIHPAPPARMRRMFSNLLTGAPVCQGSGLGVCGLCYPCSMGEWAWFACDERAGASLPEFLPLRQLTRQPPQQQLLAGVSPGIVAGRPEDELHDAWWALPAAHDPGALLRPAPASRTGIEATFSAHAGSSDGAELPLTLCRWPGHAWTGVYEGTALAESEGRNYGWVTVGCQRACTASRTGAHALRCAASTVLLPPTSLDQCNATFSTPHSSSYSGGSGSGGGGSSSSHCALLSAGAPVLSQLQARVGALARNVRALAGAVLARDGPCAQALHGGAASGGSAAATMRDAAPHSDAPAAAAQPALASHELRGPWLLLSATVDTAGACVFSQPGPHGAPLQQGAPELADLRDWGYRRYPRFGAFDYFCGVYVDVRYADGAVSTLRSPFARNASAHLHTEVLYLAHAAPVRDIRVTVFNNGPGPHAPLRVSGLSVAALPVHAGWVPPQRVAQMEAATTKLNAGWADPRVPFRGVLLPLRLLEPDLLPTLFLACPLHDVSGAALLATLAAAPLLALVAMAGCALALLRWRLRRRGRPSGARHHHAHHAAAWHAAPSSSGGLSEGSPGGLDTPRLGGFRLGGGGATPTPWMESPRAWAPSQQQQQLLLLPAAAQPQAQAPPTPRPQQQGGWQGGWPSAHTAQGWWPAVLASSVAARASSLAAASPLLQRVLWRLRLATASALKAAAAAPLDAVDAPLLSARSRLLIPQHAMSAAAGGDSPLNDALGGAVASGTSLSAAPALGRRKGFSSALDLTQLGPGGAGGVGGHTPRVASTLSKVDAAGAAPWPGDAGAPDSGGQLLLLLHDSGSRSKFV